MRILGSFKQESLVAMVALILAFSFSLGLDSYASWNNAIALMRSMAILGVFALGMIIVIIGRGVDLSQIAIGMVSAAVSVKLQAAGLSLPLALLIGLATAMAMGSINAALIHWLAIPPLFATLTSVFVFVGLARVSILPSMIINLPLQQTGLIALGQNWHSVPIPVIVFSACALLTHLFLHATTMGRFIYAYGDNAETARLSGMPVTAIVISQYVLCAMLGFVAGLLMVSTTAMVDLKTVNSTMIFDVILVVVIGGGSLAGARGGVASVLAGLLLIGVLLNGMTLMDVNGQLQNIIKGGVLLVVIMVDHWLHPYDEEDARQSV
ncbi:MAG: ABC transporter permease [Pseudomonadota bacterium]